MNTLVINTTYKHNRFLDGEYIASLNLLASVSESHYTVYALGRWGQIIKGNPLVHTFKSSKHVYDKIPTKNYPLHYTVDFNVDPYMSGLVMQLEYIESGFWNGVR